MCAFSVSFYEETSSKKTTLHFSLLLALVMLLTCGCQSATTQDVAIAGVEYEICSVYGKDGMGDTGLVHPSNTYEKEYAVDFILNTIEESPHQVEIVALGPATNIALAIKQNPETMEKVKHIWIMGTSGFGPGNATPVAEFNAFKDPDALKFFLTAGCP